MIFCFRLNFVVCAKIVKNVISCPFRAKAEGSYQPDAPLQVSLNQAYSLKIA
ncbi:MAG: hypothetical protein PHH30_02745 [Bacteroidales bacterium]|nr:hypothetical protein [Bacteroidales bacterium]